MSLAAGKIIAQNSYVFLFNTLDTMNYAGQSPTTVRLYSASLSADIQAQLIASGVITVFNVAAGGVTAIGTIS